MNHLFLVTFAAITSFFQKRLSEVLREGSAQKGFQTPRSQRDIRLGGRFGIFFSCSGEGKGESGTTAGGGLSNENPRRGVSQGGAF